MALRFIDSFDHYATADIAKKWSSSSGVTIGATGRNSTSGATITNNATKTLDNQASWVVGCAWKPSGLGAVIIIALLEGGSVQCDVRLTAAGELQVTRNGTQLAITSGFGIQVNTWYFIEFKSTINNSGSYDVHVNGSAVAALAGSGDTQATANAYANGVRIGNNAVSFIFDDVYICDGQAGASDFLGDNRVVAVLPDGAGNYTQWTPSTGSNYACVDEASMNSDMDYVSSSTADQIDTYTFGAVGVTGTVAGIQQVLTVRKDDAGSRSIASVVRIGTTDTAGTTAAASDSYVMDLTVRETKPAGGSWSVSDIDGAEFGIKLVA